MSFDAFKAKNTQRPTKFKYDKNKCNKLKYQKNSASEEDDNVSVCYSIEEINYNEIEKQNKLIAAKREYESQLLQAMQNATEKSSTIRVKSIQFLCKNLVQNYLPEFITQHKGKFTEIVEKNLRRAGDGAEQECTARLAALLVLQLGESCTSVNKFNDILLAGMQNSDMTCEARTQCCISLALINFLMPSEAKSISSLMRSVETIFRDGLLLADEESNNPDSNPELINLYADCISCWSLLLSMLPDAASAKTIIKVQMPDVEEFLELLSSSHLAIRMAAGEAIAVMIEKGRAHNKNFLSADMNEICNAVRQLAHDSSKHRAKRERRTQRANFRDILKYLEQNISPEIRVRFNENESFMLDSWAKQQQYELLCCLIGDGISLHMKQNELVRAALQLKANKDGLPEDLRSYFEHKQQQVRIWKPKSSTMTFKKQPKGRGKYSDKDLKVYI